MQPYQEEGVELALRYLPPRAKRLLEIGSDIGAEAVQALARRTGLEVVGSNISAAFPSPKANTTAAPRLWLLRADGRSLPFRDASFDAIFSLATLEHVQGIERFLAEVARVLAPGGVFSTHFGPMWSSAIGHHVCAVVGGKEARFWKPGRNPIPDHAHLLLSPDEMRAALQEGPCSPELIAPILHWIYEAKDLNRWSLEDYIAAFEGSPLALRSLHLAPGPEPAPETLAKLQQRYGSDRDFLHASMTVVLTKAPARADPRRLLFDQRVRLHRAWDDWQLQLRRGLVSRAPEVAWVVRRLRRLIHPR